MSELDSRDRDVALSKALDPRSLVDALWQSDHNPAVEPLQDSGLFALALAWLVRVLLHTPALLEHICLLEERYGESFPFPRSRRDDWGEAPAAPAAESLNPAVRAWWQSTSAAEQPPPTAPTVSFRPRQPIAPERALRVIEHGPEELSQRELAALLLSPFVLCDLAERINTQLPAYWLPRMDQLGRELMRHYGLVAPARHSGTGGQGTSSQETDLDLPPHSEETQLDLPN
jgi:hypothetical protein